MGRREWGESARQEAQSRVHGLHAKSERAAASPRQASKATLVQERERGGAVARRDGPMGWKSQPKTSMPGMQMVAAIAPAATILTGLMTITAPSLGSE